MSTTRNSIKIFNIFSEEFEKRFDFYLDAIDEIYHYQSVIGLNENELSSLTELEQNIVKSYLFMAESSNTTSIGALRLLSSNLFSDSYSLIRILYEIGCLMHYGNISKRNKEELYYTIFKSDLPEKEHRKCEWRLIKKAENRIEDESPDLIQIRKELNNFGSHVSRTKIALGNVQALGNSSASSLFTYNFHNRRFLAGLDFLYCTFFLILAEYSKHLEDYNGVTDEIKSGIKKLSTKFSQDIRPKLQSFIDQSMP